MTIGIDASRANQEQKFGTEWYAYHLITHLAEIDYQNRYFLYTKDKLRNKLANLPENFREKVLSWPPKLLWTLVRFSGEMLFRKPDLLFIPAHTIPLFHPAKTVVTCHDIGFERFAHLYSQEKIGYQNKFSRRLLKLAAKVFTGGKYGNTELDYHRWAMRFAIKRATKIITVSEFSKREVVNFYGVAPDKIVVTHLAYDPERYYPIKKKNRINQVLRKYNITLPYLFYIGRLEYKKNTPGLVRAFSLLKDKIPHQLVLVGSKGFGFEEVEEIIKKNSLEDKIIRPGWVTEEDIPYLMNGAEIFVFPSLYEGFGLPILEAMACGIPVLTSNLASMPEVAGGAALLVDPHQPEEIARGIEKIIQDENFQEDLIKKGLERVKHFSWSKCAQETLRVLEGV